MLPKGKRIEFQIASADVIHGFWVPEFLFKRDVMPDPKANHSDNVFQVSEIQETGAFVGRCTEMCGTYHSMMNFEVRVVEPNDFKAYLQYRSDQPNGTNADALQAIGQPPTGGHHASVRHPSRRAGSRRRASRDDTHAHRSQAVRVPHRVLRPVRRGLRRADRAVRQRRHRVGGHHRAGAHHRA